MIPTLTPGLKAEARTVVTKENVATVFRSGPVEVFATPALVALMEHASAMAVQDHLPEGMVTVGAAITVRHLAATPVGMEVWARAELVEVEGRRLVFRVEAWDEEEKIGEGSHERYIVAKERFMEKAARKRAGS